MEKEDSVCGRPCEVYSRVVGYLRPVQQWNKGKRVEFAKRLAFEPPDMADPRDTERLNKAIMRRFGGF